jgi:tetratricopeptide (TPR) repeat protein
MGDRNQARVFFKQAESAANDKQNPTHLQHAFQLFSSACQVDPTWWESHYQSGNNLSDLNLLHSAIACWRRALQCDISPADRAKVLVNLGWRMHCIGLVEEGKKFTLEGLAIDPKQPYGWVNLSLNNGVLYDQKGSIKAALHALKLAPHDHIVHMCLAFAYLFDGKYAEGLKWFESRFSYKLKDYLQYPYKKWNGKPNQTLFVCNDQGLGDTLSYARFIPEVCKRSKYVHARVQKELLRAFEYMFVGIKNLNLIPGPCSFPPADAWTTFVSLPHNLGLTDDQIRAWPDIPLPQVSSPPGWKLPDAKLHIGIAWAGSPLNDIDKHRSIPVHQFLELYRVNGIQLYSLQVGDRARDMHDIGAAPIIRDLNPWINDVLSTAAILPQLDLVICCESALGHICTAARKEAWIPYSYLGRDYRLSATGENQLWSSHRVFRQGPDMRWEPVFEEIIEALQERVKINDEPQPHDLLNVVSVPKKAVAKHHYPPGEDDEGYGYGNG